MNSIDSSKAEALKTLLGISNAEVPVATLARALVRRNGNREAWMDANDYLNGVVVSKRVLFTENATNTIHTGTVAIPAGALLHDIQITNQALWTATTAVMKVGDTADDDGFFASVDLKATDLVLGEVLSIKDSTMWGGRNGAYLVAATGRRGPTSSNFGLYYAAGSNVTGIITVGTPATTVGRTIMTVTYSLCDCVAAVASA